MMSTRPPQILQGSPLLLTLNIRWPLKGVGDHLLWSTSCTQTWMIIPREHRDPIFPVTVQWERMCSGWAWYGCKVLCELRREHKQDIQEKYSRYFKIRLACDLTIYPILMKILLTRPSKMEKGAHVWSADFNVNMMIRHTNTYECLICLRKI